MLQKMLRKLPHEHNWETRRIGAGLRHQVCKKCGEVSLIHVPRGGAKDHAERAKRLWHLSD